MVMYFPGAGVISDISTAAERGGFYGVFSLGTMVIATYLSCHNTNCNLDRTYSWSSDRRCVSSRTWMEVIISNLGFLVCITNSYEVFILVFVYCGLVVPLSTLVVGLRIDLFLAETSSSITGSFPKHCQGVSIHIPKWFILQLYSLSGVKQ